MLVNPLNSFSVERGTVTSSLECDSPLKALYYCTKLYPKYELKFKIADVNGELESNVIGYYDTFDECVAKAKAANESLQPIKY